MRYSCTSRWAVSYVDKDYCESSESILAFSLLAERVKGIVTYEHDDVSGLCLVVIVSINAQDEDEAARACESIVVDAIRQVWLNPKISLNGIKLVNRSKSDEVVEQLRDHPAIIALRNFANSKQMLDDIFGDPKFN